MRNGPLVWLGQGTRGVDGGKGGLPPSDCRRRRGLTEHVTPDVTPKTAPVETGRPKRRGQQVLSVKQYFDIKVQNGYIWFHSVTSPFSEDQGPSPWPSPPSTGARE